MAKNNGGAAYPSTWRARSDQGRGEVQEWHNSGMTLRDYFAAGAMQALISGNRLAGDDLGCDLSLASYRIADAMLAAREVAQ